MKNALTGGRKSALCKFARRVPRAVTQVDALPPDPIPAQSVLVGHFSTSMPIHKILIPGSNLMQLLNSFSPNIIFPQPYRPSASFGSNPVSRISLGSENGLRVIFAFLFGAFFVNIILEARSEAATHPNRFFDFTLTGRDSFNYFYRDGPFL